MRLSEHDLELIRKYNRPGPRYTSYPPAVHFTPDADRAALLADSREADGPLSLYVHLPFCESLCWFCGCNTITTTDHGRADAYLDLIEREITLLAPHLCPGRAVEQIHLGGGTPNFLTPAQITRLGELLRSRFTIAPTAELGVELDPRRLSEAQVEAFATQGFNRASFGVQDCQPEVQRAIHRVQPASDNRHAMDWLRAAGFESINVDLIYGLPLQTPETFAATLDEVLALGPDRLAVFSYAHVPWIRPAQKILEKNTLPDAETKLGLLKLVVETLTGADYEMIGFDHFARRDDELAIAQREKTLQRNFQGYSTRANLEILGFGVTAISQSPQAYRQNHKELDAYRQALEADEAPIERGYRLTAEDHVRRTVIMRLMCDLELDYAALGARLGLDFTEHFKAELARLNPLAADGLVELSSGALRVTPLGRLFIRNIAMTFDAYLRPEQQRYSRTV